MAKHFRDNPEVGETIFFNDLLDSEETTVLPARTGSHWRSGSSRNAGPRHMRIAAPAPPSVSGQTQGRHRRETISVSHQVTVPALKLVEETRVSAKGTQARFQKATNITAPPPPVLVGAASTALLEAPEESFAPLRPFMPFDFDNLADLLSPVEAPPAKETGSISAERLWLTSQLPVVRKPEAPGSGSPDAPRRTLSNEQLREWFELPSFEPVRPWYKRTPTPSSIIKASLKVAAAFAFVYGSIAAGGGLHKTNTSVVAQSASASSDAQFSPQQSKLSVQTPVLLTSSGDSPAGTDRDSGAAPSGDALVPTTSTTTAPVSAAKRFIAPVSGAAITSVFGSRVDPVTKVRQLHAGQDYGVKVGTQVHAAAAGTVTQAGWESGYGYYTCIDHGGGYSTCYAHQSKITVKVGQKVNQGDLIGLSGSTGQSTGPHLHFEVRINGTPVDPKKYL